MTHTHASKRVRLFVLLAFMAGMLGLTTFAIPVTSANAAVTSAAASCSGATTWVAGTNYNVGAIVEYPSNGDYYIATNANPGYDPTISTWYWSPYTCSSSSGGGSSCSTATTWTAGTNYAVGAIVEYPSNGQYYIATNANPGYDPTISTWYWSPYTCSSSSGGGSSCSTATTWTAGTNYAVGAIVEYPSNGQYYIATNANPGYDPTISTWFWSPYSCSGTTGGGGGGTSSGFVVSEAQFDQMFPNRNSFYTYDGLVAALSTYPGFATTGSTTVQQQEAAAFLANVDHETGGLVYINEIDQSGDYCASESYGCPAGTNAYYGRGPLQISWNFNYEAAGQAIGQDLLDNPNLVSTDAAVSWETALWYWMTQSGPGTMTAHNAMVNGSGFGQTIWALNGSVECNGGDTAEMQDRVNDYESFTSILGVSPGGNLTC